MKPAWLYHDWLPKENPVETEQQRAWDDRGNIAQKVEQDHLISMQGPHTILGPSSGWRPRLNAAKQASLNLAKQ